MTEKEDGGPAFPTESEAQTGTSTFRYEGMSMREYYAGLAMQCLLSLGYDFDGAAHDAVKAADALLAELKKEAE